MVTNFRGKKNIHNTMYFFLYLLVANLPILAAQNTARFIHVSDFHYDSSYGQQETGESCHQNATTEGMFGDFECDSPAKLVSAAVAGMKSIVPDAEFIVWTGDTVGHIPDEKYDTKRVEDALTLVTKSLKEGFPGIPTYAVLGNHDYHPTDQLPSVTNPVYKAADMLWKDWIGNTDTSNTLLNYGYYLRKHTEKQWMACLNTNLYYKPNKVEFANPEDPANQFDWLNKTLMDAKRAAATVHVISHIPTGAHPRSMNISSMWPKYNRRLLEILKEHSETVGLQLYGHEHTDNFRLARIDAETPFGVMLMGAAVTPWRSTLPGAGAQNPSFRVVTIDKNTYAPLEIEQYYLNLTEANRLGKAEFRLEYNFSRAYDFTPPFTTKQFADLYEKFLNDDDLFQMYFKYNSVQKDTFNCTGKCKQALLCATAYPDMETYYACTRNEVATTTSTPTTPSTTTTGGTTVVGTSTGLLCVQLVAISVLRM